jgi:hypothetical protein
MLLVLLLAPRVTGLLRSVGRLVKRAQQIKMKGVFKISKSPWWSQILKDPRKESESCTRESGEVIVEERLEVRREFIRQTDIDFRLLCVSLLTPYLLFYFVFFSLSFFVQFSCLCCCLSLRLDKKKENLLCALRLYLSLGWSACLFDFLNDDIFDVLEIPLLHKEWRAHVIFGLFKFLYFFLLSSSYMLFNLLSVSLVI